ncbi:MAG TPA: hypothetical protein VKM72_10695 [Thermoanaerobaculia bacterium]|nr:hypothetical protein [Thermoanaerobaculia bacterium]
MFRHHFARALVLSLSLALTAQAAWAGPHRTGEDSGSAWSLFTQLWYSITGSWIDAGCGLDPYGRCKDDQTVAPSPETEAGCIADPHGGCATGPLAEVGCILDSHGGCRQSQSTTEVDAGCGLDPHGGCRGGS